MQQNHMKSSSFQKRITEPFVLILQYLFEMILLHRKSHRVAELAKTLKKQALDNFRSLCFIIERS